MKLYGFKTTRAYKCLWLIRELGIDCEYIEVNLMESEHKTKEFLEINPFGKVPALVDGDLKLHEASAICNYLAEKFPGKNLIPKNDLAQKAVYDKWMFFMSNELECHLWTIEKNSWLYPEEKRSKNAIEMAKLDFINAVKVINDELEKKEFLLGENFSVADVSLGYLLRWARSHKLLDDFPKLSEYLEKLMARENYPSELFKK